MALRVVIVGAGSIARRHARACEAVAEAELAAVCDVREEAARALAEEVGVPVWYTDLQALTARGPIDIAIVATWGPAHAEVVGALARSGAVRAILCEKPFSQTAAEAEGMAEAAAADGVLLAEAFKFRHHPLHLTTQFLIRAGRLGAVSHVRSTFSVRAPAAVRRPELNWRFDAARGGGAIYDLACYTIHHARMVMEAEPAAVHAVGRWGELSGVDEVVTATLLFPGGRTAQWWVSFGDTPSQAVEIHGSEAMIAFDQAWNNEDKPTALRLRDAAGHEEVQEFAPVDQFALQLQHLCDCLMRGAPHRIPTANSVAQMRTIDALYRSLRSGEVVAL